MDYSPKKADRPIEEPEKSFAQEAIKNFFGDSNWICVDSNLYQF
ncbi:MAG: hypothetical protein QNJ34_15755 [Xenococcaceae cyanobacterium MO_188.B29]|nr:hypothetical protein [Xenococcaceae cyanobacterium MO_188.B29]